MQQANGCPPELEICLIHLAELSACVCVYVCVLAIFLQIKLRAKELSKKIEESGKFRGKTGEAKTACCVYLACKQEGAPRSIKEVGSRSTQQTLGFSIRSWFIDWFLVRAYPRAGHQRHRRAETRHFPVPSQNRERETGAPAQTRPVEPNRPNSHAGEQVRTLAPSLP